MDQQRNTKRLKHILSTTYKTRQGLKKSVKRKPSWTKQNKKPVEHRNTCLWSELDDQSNLHNAIKLYWQGLLEQWSDTTTSELLKSSMAPSALSHHMEGMADKPNDFSLNQQFSSFTCKRLQNMSCTLTLAGQKSQMWSEKWSRCRHIF